MSKPWVPAEDSQAAGRQFRMVERGQFLFLLPPDPRPGQSARLQWA